MARPGKRLVTTAVVQHACDDDPRTNLERTADGIRMATQRGANLILLPELHRTRYFCQSERADHFDLAEPIPGPTTEALAALASELSVVVVGSIFERRTRGLYHNTAVVIDRAAGLIGRYRKMHIPDDPGYFEKYYFTPGDQGFTPIDTSLGRLGVLVCWDQWFPEAARLMALAGAEILLYPTAIGDDPDEPADVRERHRNAWQTMQRAHAIANGIPVAVANRVGSEPRDDGGQGIRFWGSSFLCGPLGEVVAESPDDAASVLVHPFELEQSDSVRRVWPFLRDRRVDAYAGLTEIFRDR